VQVTPPSANAMEGIIAANVSKQTKAGRINILESPIELCAGSATITVAGVSMRIII
jgi:hypothetical protein